MTKDMISVHMSDGANLKIKILGDGVDKPLLIAHHGAPGALDHQDPEEAYGFLTEKFRVLVFDARGSGESDQKGPFSHQRSWAKADKFVMAGGSYGGIISLEYAVAYPNRLTGLILKNTTPYGPGTIKNLLEQTKSSAAVKVDEERQARLWTGKLLSDEDYEKGWLDIIPLVTTLEVAAPQPHESSSPSTQAERPEKRQRYHALTQNAAFGNCMPKYDLRQQLGRISVPTLIVAGRKYKLCPVSCSQEIEEGIPNSKLVIFEEAGHNAPVEQAEQFQVVAWSFLDSLLAFS
ncbi:Alpha/Beta hydrolase protein [Trichoderma velutinum]